MRVNPYEAPSTIGAPRHPPRNIPLTFRQTLPVWWSIVWRASIYGVLGGFLLGAVGGVIALASGTPEKAPIYGAIAGYLAAIPCSLFAAKQALSKHLDSLVALAGSQA